MKCVKVKKRGVTLSHLFIGASALVVSPVAAARSAADPRDKHLERIFASMNDRYEAAVKEAGGKTHRCRITADDLRCAFFAGPRGSFTIFDSTDGIFEVNVLSHGRARVIVHGAHDSDLGIFARSRKDPACWVAQSEWSPICVW
jgi:hypothetical protein